MEGERVVIFDKTLFQNKQFPRFFPNPLMFPLFRSGWLPIYTATQHRRLYDAAEIPNRYSNIRNGDVMVLPLNLRAFAEAVLPAPLFQRLSA